MQKTYKLLTCITIAFSSITNAHILDNGYGQIYLGGHNVSKFKDNNIKIDTLIGNDYKPKDNLPNFLLGVGYFVNGFSSSTFDIHYGINIFYLNKTVIRGDVIQEKTFNNLEYKFTTTSIPSYLSVISKYKYNNQISYGLTLGAGVSSNKSYDYKEKSLDGGITVPDNFFSSKRVNSLSFTTGINIGFIVPTINTPIDCGYRLFYLGKYELKRKSIAVSSTIENKNTYVNALICSINIGSRFG